MNSISNVIMKRIDETQLYDIISNWRFENDENNQKHRKYYVRFMQRIKWNQKFERAFFERKSIYMFENNWTMNFFSIDFARFWCSMFWSKFFEKRRTWISLKIVEHERFKNLFLIWLLFLCTWLWSLSFENIEQMCIW